MYELANQNTFVPLLEHMVLHVMQCQVLEKLLSCRDCHGVADAVCLVMASWVFATCWKVQQGSIHLGWIVNSLLQIPSKAVWNRISSHSCFCFVRGYIHVTSWIHVYKNLNDAGFNTLAWQAWSSGNGYWWEHCFFVSSHYIDVIITRHPMISNQQVCEVIYIYYEYTYIVYCTLSVIHLFIFITTLQWIVFYF